jgi:hypothetical protein
MHLFLDATMSNLGQGYWECRQVEGTHTRDKGEKDRKVCSSIPAIGFSPVMLLALLPIYTHQIKFEWGQTMACVKSVVVFPECRSTIYVLHLRPQLLPSPNSHQICAQISPQSLHLSPTFKHLLKEQINSYPMHVSGHGMVEWVQRYACAKLSETVWLAEG